MSSLSHFIPMRRQNLVAHVNRERDDDFAALASLIHQLLRHEADERAEALRETYAPFDPDPVADAPPADGDEDAFLAAGEDILLAANFRRVSQEELDEAFATRSLFPLQPKVDTEAYDVLRMYRRGKRDVQEKVRSWRTLWRWRTVDITLWERLVVILRLKDGALAETGTARTRGMEAGRIYLKSFKNIPPADVEMILPNTQLRLRRIDRALIGGPLVAGIVWTVLQSVSILAAVAAGAFALSLDDGRVRAAGGVLLVLAGYLWRTQGKIKRTRLQYMQTLSQGLYFLNLANNRSVLHQLLAFARDADEKEALLAYHVLQRDGPMTGDALDRAAEAWIADATGRDADFDVQGGLATLTRWGLVEPDGPGFAAVPVDEAGSRLRKRWVEAIGPALPAAP